jgi:hypothetical protein
MREERTFMKCAGEISFEYFYQPPGNAAVAASSAADPDGDDGDEESKLTTAANRKSGRLISLYVPKEEMFDAPRPSSSSSPSSPSSTSTSSSTTKRRKIVAGAAAAPPPAPRRAIKSTRRLFRECLAKIREQLSAPPRCDADGKTMTTAMGGLPLPQERLFALLSSVRLARSFHLSASRVAAVKRRLRALICVVHAFPDQEGICSYFVAQPELTGELVDLLRPTVSSGSATSGFVGRRGNHVDDPRGGGGDVDGSILAALSDSPLVPYDVRTLAVEALTALVARRDVAQATSGSASMNVARQTNVLSELGVGKGHYLGLLPTLIRYSLAALNSFFLLHDQERKHVCGGDDGVGRSGNETRRSGDVGKDSEDDVKNIGLELGLAFLRATKPPPLPLKEREERALEFIDSVLTLTSAVISVPSGTASLTDCGIIPALVSTIALDGQMARRSLSLQAEVVLGENDDDPRLSSSVSSPFITGTATTTSTTAITDSTSNTTEDEESYSDCLLKFISAQAIQILEGAIVTHTSALSAFHELKGVDILVQRLSVEVEKVKFASSPSAPGIGDGSFGDAIGQSDDVSCAMVLSGNSTTSSSTTMEKILPTHRRRNLQAARRVLLFSAVNCLTVSGLKFFDMNFVIVSPTE